MEASLLSSNRAPRGCCATALPRPLPLPRDDPLPLVPPRLGPPRLEPPRNPARPPGAILKLILKIPQYRKLFLPLMVDVVSVGRLKKKLYENEIFQPCQFDSHSNSVAKPCTPVPCPNLPVALHATLHGGAYLSAHNQVPHPLQNQKIRGATPGSSLREKNGSGLPATTFPDPPRPAQLPCSYPISFLQFSTTGEPHHAHSQHFRNRNRQRKEIRQYGC